MELGNDSSSLNSAISSSSRARREQRPQFAELVLDRVVAGESGGAFELPNEGMKRAVLVVRRAKIAQARMRLACNVLGKRCGEPRLADARLAGDQHHPPFAALRLLPAAQQQFDFLVASDERRLPERSASNRLTSPLSPKTRQAGCGSAKPASCWGPRSSRSNSSPICCRVLAAMTSAVRRSERLQPRREIRGLADDRLFLRRALADQIADDHQPGGDADPHLGAWRI